MKKEIRILLIVVLVFMLIGVRVIIEPCFYDPLITYFKNDYLHKSIPSLHISKYLFNIFLRYFLNTILSLIIIYLVFKNLKSLIFSVKFYLVAFLILTFTLFLVLKFNFTENYIFLFYVRRFLIHPLFLFILLPAFYYEHIKNKKKPFK